jgi:hypothetical protein
MTPFVWTLVGEDACETLTHIVTRKEAERRTGRGEFWWGLSTPLGDSVETAAIVNKGTLLKPMLILSSNLTITSYDFV